MIRWRHYTLVICFVAACVGLLVRVVYLNVTEREFLIGEGDARSIREESIAAYRGVVYDRFGEPLAVSTPVFAVWTDPSREHLDTNGIEQLAGLLDLSAPKLTSTLAARPDREFVYLKRRVSWDAVQQVRASGLKGVHFESEYRRYYPAGETTAHLVGVTDIDDRGLEGIELSFDKRLQGEPGHKRVLKDRRGDPIKNLVVSTPRFGTDLTLSIDLRLQFLAYRELKTVVQSHRALSGSMVMVDVRSGEILALVNQPSYNPNDLTDRSAAGMRNRAVTDTYEPGSTIKPFTVLAALESGNFQRGTVIDTSPGYFRVGSKLVEDPVNRGAISLETALKKSSQVGIAKVALELQNGAVFDMLMRAGFGDYPGTGMPGEVAGSISNAGLGNPVVRATLSYGYGLAVSPLQLAQAYLCIASGGMRIPVSILRQTELPPRHRVMDEKLALEVLSMMEGVTDPGGTAPRARIPGYRVAGKTGTARKVGAAGYDDERHVAWFAGVAPASQPRIVAVVAINEPRSMAKGGGEVAAPVFGQVVARALRLLGVPADQEVAI